VILIIREKATTEQVQEMLSALGDYIKLAVDVRQSILAGGGEMHADCELTLLTEGSGQVDVWGADWIPDTQSVRYESLINIRPRQNNRRLEIESVELRQSVERIVLDLLGGITND
jgi:hypothetical protein